MGASYAQSGTYGSEPCSQMRACQLARRGVAPSRGSRVTRRRSAQRCAGTLPAISSTAASRRRSSPARPRHPRSSASLPRRNGRLYLRTAARRDPIVASARGCPSETSDATISRRRDRVRSGSRACAEGQPRKLRRRDGSWQAERQRLPTSPALPALRARGTLRTTRPPHEAAPRKRHLPEDVPREPALWGGIVNPTEVPGEELGSISPAAPFGSDVPAALGESRSGLLRDGVHARGAIMQVVRRKT